MPGPIRHSEETAPGGPGATADAPAAPSRATDLSGRLLAVLDQLGDSPGTIFLLLLVLNAVAMPYADLVHDAILYRFQVLNRVEGGAFAEDLYFKFGSQDRYSAFSLLAAPVAQVLGLSAGAFVLFLLGNTLFYFALQRFVLALVPDRAAAVAGLLFIAVTPIPFGGLNKFPVNENFLTPRLFAVAFVMLGMERLLSGRWLTALALHMLAGLFHPLMAIGGLAVCLLTILGELTSQRAAGVILGLAALAAVPLLACQPLGVALFGYLDPEWRDAVEGLLDYNFPNHWWKEDWLRILVTLAVLGVDWHAWHPDRRRQGFLQHLQAVACLGLTGTILAQYLPYALLLQGQPYRALWPTQILLVPLGFFLVRRAWSHPRPWCRALGRLLLGYLGVCGLGGTGFFFLLLFLLFFLVLAGFHRGLGRQPRSPDWAWVSTGEAAAIALGLGTVLKGWVFLNTVDEGTNLWHPLELNRYVHLIFDPFFQLVLCGGGVLLAARWLGSRWFSASMVILYLGIEVGSFALQQHPAYQEKLRPELPDAAWVRELVRTRLGSLGRVPTVYWPVEAVDLLWLELRANSYFHHAQLVGCIFRREVMVEGKRRLALVERFEEPWVARRLLGRDPEAGPPTAADLERLCEEPEVDLVILKQDLEGLAFATNGRWFAYNPAEVRARRRGAARAGWPQLPSLEERSTGERDTSRG